MPEVDKETLAEHARTFLIGDRCSLTHHVLTNNFSELRLLQKTVEELIIREERSEIEQLDRLAKGLPEHAQGEYWAENHPYQWEHIIAEQFRASFFLTLMAAAEFHLGRLAEDAATITREVDTSRDGQAGFYKRTRRFLRKCGTEGPGEAKWQTLGQLYEIRNMLAHRGMTIGDDVRAQRVMRSTQQMPGITVETGHLKLSKQFCDWAVDEVSGFVEEVWEDLAKVCDRITPVEYRLGAEK
jgi:hypothetical protein